MTELMVFLKGVAKNPAGVGAVAPSSPFLADRVVSSASLREDHVIAELGAGTGSITKRILEEAPRARLLALEPDADLARMLRREVPGVEVAERRAEDLPDVVREWGHLRVDRVISGLPWTLWPAWVQEPIVDAVAAAMAPQGRMVTFTYLHSQVLPASLRFRKILQRYFGVVRRTRIQWANLPPAFVYVCDGPRPAPLSRAVRSSPVRVLDVPSQRTLLSALRDGRRRGGLRDALQDAPNA